VLITWLPLIGADPTATSGLSLNEYPFAIAATSMGAGQDRLLLPGTNRNAGPLPPGQPSGVV